MNNRNRVFLLVLSLLLGTYRLAAQDPQQPPPQEPQPQQPQQPPPDQAPDQDNPFGGPPKPAGQALPSFDFGIFGSGSDLHPDYTPLTGMLNAGLGFPEVKHSYWVPGVQFGSTVQSNLFGSSRDSGWYNTNYLTGDLSLLEAWSRSQLALNYSGGGTFSTNSTEGNSGFQQLAFAQTFLLNRWIIQIVDEFSQLPESGFGFGIGMTLGIPGVGGVLAPVVPGVGSNYSPNQSVFTGFGPRISNVAVMQATFQLTRRSSITASGSYGLLHYTDPGNIDTYSAFGSLGYNYQLSKKDSIGLFYEISTYHFPGNPQAFGTQTVSAAYARKITGRLALSLYGGPQFTSLRIPVGTTSSLAKGNLVNGYASAFLNYAFTNGGISARYLHGVSGGGGVLTGSISDIADISASRKLTRVWHGSVNFGYSHNTTIGDIVGTPGNPSFNDWFAGASIGRPFGRDLTIFLSYVAYFETNNPNCSIPGCGVSSNTNAQTVTVNIRWHPRPFALE